MDLEELRAIATLAETGSLLKTATVLGLSRTTLRRRLEALEARAGVPLIERTRAGATLTPAGALMASRGRAMVQDAAGLLAAAREIGREPTGVLRVVLPIGLPPNVLTLLLGIMRTHFPHLRYRVRFAPDPIGGALDEVDLAVHFGSVDPPGPWVGRPFYRVREWLIASSRYLERHKPIKSIEDLAHHTLLAWEGPGCDPNLWPTTRGGWFPVQPFLTTPHIHWLRQCVIEGLGIALVPDGRLPDPGVPPGLICGVLPDEVGRERTLRLVVPAATVELPKIKAVLGAAERWAQTHRAATR
jgi:DNA-binding transcriptional LysR family regulator